MRKWITAGVALAALLTVVIAGSSRGNPAAGITVAAWDAWVATDPTGDITLVDAYDATVVGSVHVAAATDQLTIAQDGSDAYVADQDTRRIAVVSTAAMAVTRQSAPVPGQGPIRLLAGPGAVYATYGSALAWYPPGTLTPRTVPLAVPPAHTQIAPAAGGLVLADLAAGRAELVSSRTGKVTASLLLRTSTEAATVVSASATSPVVYLVTPRPGRDQAVVSICAFTAGSCRHARQVGSGAATCPPGSSAAREPFGPLTQASGTSYVPDYLTGVIYAIPASGGVRQVRVTTRCHTFDLFTQDGIAFFNDPAGPQAGVLGPGTRLRLIEKYRPVLPPGKTQPATPARTRGPHPSPASSPTPTTTLSKPSPTRTAAPTATMPSPSPTSPGTPPGSPPPKRGPSGTPTPTPTNSGGIPASCSEASTSSLSDQTGIPLSNADLPSGDQPQPAGPAKGEWGPRKIAILGLIGAIFGGVPAAVLTGIFGLIHQPQNGPAPPPQSPTPAISRTTPREPAATVTPPASPALTLTDPHGTGVYGVAFTRGGTLAVGDLNGSAYLWNVARATVTGTFPDSSGQGIFGVTISPDGRLLAADTFNDPAYTKGSVVLWRPPADKPVATLTAPDNSGFGNPPALSPDGGTLAGDSADGSIYLWDSTTGKPTGTLTDPGTQVDFGIAFSPATGFLAAADHNGNAYLWNTKQSRIVRTFQDPSSRGVSGVAFNPDGSILATGDDNGNVYLWNVSTGARIATLYGPKGGTDQSIAFSPHGGIVAATSDNDTSRKYVTCVWSLTGKPLATLQNPGSEGVTRIAFSPDGSLLAVGDENAHTYLWDMTKLTS